MKRLAILILALALAGCAPQPQSKKPCCPGPCQPAVRVIAFTASWCGPCQRAKPVLARVQATGVDVQVIDVDRQPDLARKYSVTSVPTFIVHTRTGVERTQDISAVLRILWR